MTKYKDPRFNPGNPDAWVARSSETGFPAGGHNFKTEALRDKFIADELLARQQMLAHFARTGPADRGTGLVAQHRARQRHEEAVWRSIEFEIPELRAYDEAERAAHQHADMVEDLEADRRADDLNTALEGWNVGSRSLLGPEFKPGYVED